MEIKRILIPSLANICGLYIVVSVDEIGWEGRIDEILGDDDRIAVSRNRFGSETMICEEFHEEVCGCCEFGFVLWIR